MNDAQGATLLTVARDAIATRLGTQGVGHVDYPWLHDPAATFVTLTQQGALRGCIGSLEAHRPLLEDVSANAVAAATRDPRFPSLRASELDHTRIEVSLLSGSTAMGIRVGIARPGATASRCGWPRPAIWPVARYVSPAGLGVAAACGGFPGRAETQGGSAGGILGRGCPPVALYRRKMERRGPRP